MMSVTLWSISFPAIHYTDIQQYATNIKNTLALTNIRQIIGKKIFELRLAEKYLSPVSAVKYSDFDLDLKLDPDLDGNQFSFHECY